MLGLGDSLRVLVAYLLFHRCSAVDIFLEIFYAWIGFVSNVLTKVQGLKIEMVGGIGNFWTKQERPVVFGLEKACLWKSFSNTNIELCTKYR